MYFALFLGGSAVAALVSAVCSVVFGLPLLHTVILWWMLLAAFGVSGLAMLAIEGRLGQAPSAGRGADLQLRRLRR